MRGVLLVLEFTLREALRRKLVLVLLGLTVLFLAFYLYGVVLLDQRVTERARELGFDRPARSAQAAFAIVTVLGLYLVNFLAALMAVLSSVAAISGEIESGTLQAVAYKPITRAQFVIGKWLGFAVINVAYVSLLASAMIVGVQAITGYAPPSPLPAILLIDLGVLFLVTLTVLGGTIFSTLANGIGVFVLFGLGWAGGILAVIGRITDTPLMVQLGRSSQFVTPTDALWRGASYYLQPELLLSAQRMDRGGGNPFLGTEPPEFALLAWTGVYILLALTAAALIFRRRDL